MGFVKLIDFGCRDKNGSIQGPGDSCELSDYVSTKMKGRYRRETAHESKARKAADKAEADALRASQKAAAERAEEVEAVALAEAEATEAAETVSSDE